MGQPGRSPEVDAALKKLQGVQSGEHLVPADYSTCLDSTVYCRYYETTWTVIFSGCGGSLPTRAHSRQST